jgi:hypothetical protein
LGTPVFKSDDEIVYNATLKLSLKVKKIPSLAVSLNPKSNKPNLKI